MNSTKRILIAPLNWGLGHATRCMPVIDLIRKSGHTVAIASDGAALELLKNEYHDLEFIELPSYNISYGKKGSIFSIAKNIPGIHRAIAAEQKASKGHLTVNNYDLIIADNRYGIYSERIPSVIISHQLKPLLPNGWSVIQKLVHATIAKYLSNFSEAWVPDDPQLNLSGKLSEGNLKIEKKYIGLLSRFEEISPENKKYNIAAILSGPEPQRTILEKKLEEQLKDLPLKSILVSGQPDSYFTPPDPGKKFQKINYLPATELNEVILQSEMIICRSGYSSIMDLLKLNQKGLLIPTPGQSEQEYLAERMSENPAFTIQKQDNINIFQAYEKLKGQLTRVPKFKENNLLVSAVDHALSSSAHLYHL